MSTGNDHQLAIRLAADASELKRAQAEGAAGFEKLAAAGADANRQLGAAAQAEAAARKSATEALRLEREARHAAKVEANLLAQANKQLAMNMTDVVVGITTGQPAWMIAIQQGGQIRDAYGGILPAGRAVLGLMSPLTVAVGAAGAAAAAAAVAYSQGASELQAYGRALAATNGAAGVTRYELAGLARDMSGLGTTQAQAAGALSLAAGSGAIASQNLRMVSAAALDLQRVGGPAMEDTIAKFVELGRAPTAASEKLNATLHYLTATTYDQIRALEKQGEFSRAAALAQEEFARATRRQAEEVGQQLGALERAWKGAGEMAAWAWDKMRNIGRPMTPAEELALLQEQLAKPQRRGGDGVQADLRRDAQTRRVAELQMQIYMEGEAAAAQQSAADATDKHIREAAQREAEAKARTAERLQVVKDALQVEVAAYAQAGELLQTYKSANLLTEESYYAAKRALIQANASAQRQALEAENKALQAQTVFGADAIARDAAVAHNRRLMATITTKAAGDVAQATVEERLALEALNRTQVEYEQTLMRVNGQRALSNTRGLNGLRQGDNARGIAAREAAIVDRYNSDVDQVNSDRFNGRISPAQAAERLNMLKVYYDQALQQESAYQDARARLEADSTVGFDRALANYTAAARNAAQQSEQSWTRAFGSMEDAIVQFATTGKISFSGLANSIISDLIRIYLRKQLVGMFDTGMQSFMNWNAGGSAGFGNDAPMGVGSVFHGGGKVGTDAPMAMRLMPASMWDHAPRFHSGRLAPDEMAAILQKDESVLTPAQMRQLAPVGSGGAAAPSLNLQISVVNQTGTPVNATARQTGDGGIEVLLSSMQEAMAGDVSGGQGPLYVAMKQRFNLVG